MNDFLSWLDGPRLPPTAMAVAFVCALAGAVILSLFTRLGRLTSFVINLAALFLGAYVANVLGARVDLPLERYYLKPMVLSFLGMSVSAVLMLMLLSRSRNTE